MIRDVDVKFGFDTEMCMERKKINVICHEKLTKKGHILALKLYTLPTWNNLAVANQATVFSLQYDFIRKLNLFSDTILLYLRISQSYSNTVEIQFLQKTLYKFQIIFIMLIFQSVLSFSGLISIFVRH